MLRECPEIDAVSVIVPNKYHAPVSLQALAAGKHVFCEKPPAMNVREARAMAAAAAKKKLTLMFNFNNRARPESYAMMEYVRRGQVGRINSAQAKWIRRTGIPGLGGWFTTKALSGGGPLIDLVHMLDLALYFMGYPEPEWVMAQTFNDFIKDKNFKGPWGIPDVAKGVTDVESACHGMIKCKTGQVISLQISWAEMVKREEVSVVFQGTKAGGLVQRLFGVDGIDATATDTCELYVQENGRSVNRSILVSPDETMGRTRSAANFIKTLEGSEAPLNTPDQAVSLMRIIDAAYASARTGRPVKC
jgi:predicted dehydrogenase